MKRYLIKLGLAFFFLTFSVFADVDVWNDIVKNDNLKQAKQLSLDFKLKRVTSQKDLQQILTEKIVNNIDKVC